MCAFGAHTHINMYTHKSMKIMDMNTAHVCVVVHQNELSQLSVTQKPRKIIAHTNKHIHNTHARS
jgi:hypothetical protein